MDKTMFVYTLLLHCFVFNPIDESATATVYMFSTNLHFNLNITTISVMHEAIRVFDVG